MAGCCEHGNEPLEPIKFGELIDNLRNCYVFKKDSAGCSQSSVAVIVNTHALCFLRCLCNYYLPSTRYH